MLGMNVMPLENTPRCTFHFHKKYHHGRRSKFIDGSDKSVTRVLKFCVVMDFRQIFNFREVI
jgi:hypothetical protein